MRISLFGVERPDLAYFTAFYLKQTKKTVLVVDNSLHGSLFATLAGTYDTQEEHLLEFGNMLLARNLEYDETMADTFDYVVAYYGFASPDGFAKDSDHIFLLPDYHTYSLQRMKELVFSLKDAKAVKNDFEHLSIIMRDMVTEKVTDDAVALEIGVPLQTICGAIVEDMKDHMLELALEYNGIQHFKGHSNEYTNALLYIIGATTGENIRVVKKNLSKI